MKNVELGEVTNFARQCLEFSYRVPDPHRLCCLSVARPKLLLPLVFHSRSTCHVIYRETISLPVAPSHTLTGVFLSLHVKVSPTAGEDCGKLTLARALPSLIPFSENVGATPAVLTGVDRPLPAVDGRAWSENFLNSEGLLCCGVESCGTSDVVDVEAGVR
jgi:hypothetical protein